MVTLRQKMNVVKKKQLREIKPSGKTHRCIYEPYFGKKYEQALSNRQSNLDRVIFTSRMKEPKIEDLYLAEPMV